MSVFNAVTEFLFKFKDLVMAFFAYLLGRKQGKLEIENKILKLEKKKREEVTVKIRGVRENWGDIISDYTHGVSGEDDSRKP